MAEILDFTECRRVTLAEALTTTDNAVRVLQATGGEPVPTRPMLWPAEVTASQVSGLHDVNAAPAITPDVYAYFVRDAVVGGYGTSVVKDGAHVFGRSAFPYYVRAFIEQELGRSHWGVEPREKRFISRPVYVISHFNPIYGHWLLEIMPKLFGMAAWAAQGFTAPVVLSNQLPPLVKETVRRLLPTCPVIEYDPAKQVIVARRVILPGMMQNEYVYNQHFRRSLDVFLAPLRRLPGPDKLFVSRAGMTEGFRRMENAGALDALAERLGLTVIRPETLPWLEQLRLFASARLVAGEFGSGLHNTMFSPRGCKVVCLNVLVEVQSKLANAFRHDLGYIIDPVGGAVRYEMGWTEQQLYRADLDQFEARVRPLIESM